MKPVNYTADFLANNIQCISGSQMKFRFSFFFQGSLEFDLYKDLPQTIFSSVELDVLFALPHSLTIKKFFAS